jgi:predicted glycosyltransferase
MAISSTSKRGRESEADEPYPRVLLYSHDSWGLGHLRRSLTIGSALTEAFPRANALVVTGSPCATHFRLPERVALVKLPAVTKGSTGAYRPRSLSGSLSAVMALRERILLETFRGFDPHLLIVDHQVTGLHGEALSVLREARRLGVRTIFGLRDVLDSPEVVTRAWSGPEFRWALTRGYDRICVYGSPEVFDPRGQYPFLNDLGDRLRFTGYVVRPKRDSWFRPFPSLRPQVLVTVGGGEDGAERLDLYLDALEGTPPTWDSTLVFGPLLDESHARSFKRRARRIPGVRAHRFYSDLPRLLAEADVIVSMAGYNSSAEILQTRRPAVLLPRTWPRREQLIRARSLSRLGLAETLVQPRPADIRSAVQRALDARTGRPRTPPLDGRSRLCELAAELLRIPSLAMPQPSLAGSSG